MRRYGQVASPIPSHARYIRGDVYPDYSFWSLVGTLTFCGGLLVYGAMHNLRRRFR